MPTASCLLDQLQKADADNLQVSAGGDAMIRWRISSPSDSSGQWPVSGVRADRLFLQACQLIAA